MNTAQKIIDYGKSNSVIYDVNRYCYFHDNEYKVQYLSDSKRLYCFTDGSYFMMVIHSGCIFSMKEFQAV